ncbi:hypothetical protein NE237_029496 [Protea cynaroides]|uniref:Uncharacterized protein n=1 Tax=Protea cynaroides TaxID=273540 RepID=A0A9Q0GSA9_9MAGN|nr:hypothetical protein NE237_029496 [Protea cynaroides]
MVLPALDGFVKKSIVTISKLQQSHPRCLPPEFIFSFQSPNHLTSDFFLHRNKLFSPWMGRDEVLNTVEQRFLLLDTARDVRNLVLVPISQLNFHILKLG